MSAFTYNKAASRASVCGQLTKGHLRQLANDKPRVIYLESVEDSLIHSAIEIDSVRHIILRGCCSIGPALLECFPKLEILRASGYIKIGLPQRRLFLKEVEVTDLASPISEILDFIQTERLEVTGSAIALKKAILGQERLAALRLQETKLNLHDIDQILSKLKVLCVYRTYQNDYLWLKKLGRLEMLSIAFQKGLRDISPIGEMAALVALDISSQRGLSGFDGPVGRGRGEYY